MKAFYLKYRPKVISELDNVFARESLGKIFSQEQIPHAFLFAGPKGIGKTSSARILAKTLGCLKRKGMDACGQCDFCLETDRGASLDILEIDAASNRGIDDVRQIRDKVALSPIKAKNKIYIIDEVHMLTNEAFNAILKTLEEPPSHVYFIFCTTDPEKMPATVRSRLLTIRFPRASQKEVFACLKRVVKGENLKIEDKSLRMIANGADGSFRDAHKILYQLAIGEGKKISFSATKKVLGRLSLFSPSKMVEMILAGKQKEALAVSRKLENEGVDFADFLKRCLERVQKIILAKAGVEKGVEREMELADLEMSALLRLSEALVSAWREQKTTAISALPLQILIAAWPGNGRGLNGKKRKRAKEPPPSFTKAKTVPAPETKKGKVAGGENLAGFTQKWDQLILSVKPLNHSVGALLKACRPLSVQENKLTVGVAYEFHKERLEEGRNRQIMAEGMRRVFGGDYQICYVLSKREKGEEAKPHFKAKDKKGKNGEEAFAAAKEIFG